MRESLSDERPILRPAPGQLVGERIVVRGYTDADAEVLNEAIQESIEHLRPWMPWCDQHATVADTLVYVRRAQAEYIMRNGFPMGIFSHGGRCLGSSGLHVHNWDLPSFEIGYWIRQSEEGKGYVSEAVRLVTAYAFDAFGAERIIIRCLERNTRSAAVADRLGYVYEGTMRHHLRDPAGKLANMMCYSMLREEYERHCARR